MVGLSLFDVSKNQLVIQASYRASNNAMDVIK